VRRLASCLALGAVLLAQSPQRLLPFNEQVHRRILADNKGKVLLVNFWATWCAPCRAEMPQLVELHRKYQSKGFRLVTVSADEPPDAGRALEFLQKVGAPAPAYRKDVPDDDQLIRAVNPDWSGALPASFLYDRNGKLVRAFVGEVAVSEIQRAIEKLL